MKNIYSIIFLSFFTLQTVTSQVLWFDDFDNYPVGLLSTDNTGVNSGLGNWYVNSNYGQIKIETVAGRGNVMSLGWLNGVVVDVARQENIDLLWNSRTGNNNILKLDFQIRLFKYDVHYYSTDINFQFENTPNFSQFEITNTAQNAGIRLTDNYTNTIPYNKDWINVEVYIDYNSNTIHYYLPDYLYYASEYRQILGLPKKLLITQYCSMPENTNTANTQINYMSISAIPSLPNYLNTESFITSNFIIYPNPVKDIIIVSNSKNIGIEELEICDINGKKILSKKCNNENEVQLNISDLTVGTYLLHIKTSKGTAVKKIVKE